MTERKPPGMTFETWIDKQIRTAQERGDFDDLPGAGKPLPGAGKPHDELWWVKNYIQREGLSAEALLPTPVQLRKEIQRLPDTVRELPSEQAVRETVEELNRRIVDWLRAPSGPQVPVGPVDAEAVVQQWRADRQAAQRRAAATAPVEQPATPSRRPRWWHRFTRRVRSSG
ncbi:uncharacterized protein DUF1992 [Halopolyspora algeriensis]|uniref:Uncharacterized protein DUF1992 n=1 Tax=Halopolyspora algeriensis TaxID=1500506 RepID=A0A368VXS0_9ACTN|nr:DUF1992 domain-containing protein [Halopolyspora algeriensis]RCW46107.1 uncharacterized protein DUF1992 [Halopolyspora algeriensis]TQM55510.1 uncharacterized protein DUF1992 [Halopolyspora algeriensis]